MEKHLVLHPEKCINCRSCTLMCSMRHYRIYDPKLSAVTVFRFVEDGINVPVMCLQCEDPKCVRICSGHALTRLPSGMVELNRDRCIGCKYCIQACPTGTMIHSSEYDALIKCDLCEGDALCARWCPTKAIEFTDTPTGFDRRLAGADALKPDTLDIEGIRGTAEPSYALT
jgi:Fe-S-cluster-containing hydrogenase component 2